MHNTYSQVEKAIIQDGVNHGVSKKLAIAIMQRAEKDGLKPEQVAAVLGLPGSDRTLVTEAAENQMYRSADAAAGLPQAV